MTFGQTVLLQEQKIILKTLEQEKSKEGANSGAQLIGFLKGARTLSGTGLGTILAVFSSRF